MSGYDKRFIRRETKLGAGSGEHGDYYPYSKRVYFELGAKRLEDVQIHRNISYVHFNN